MEQAGIVFSSRLEQAGVVVAQQRGCHLSRDRQRLLMLLAGVPVKGPFRARVFSSLLFSSPE